MAGFDVYGDLVAAVADDSRVQIWDVKHGGSKPRQTAPLNATPTRSATCVRFVGGEKDGKGLRLMIVTGSTISEIKWGKQVDEDEE